MLTSAVIKFTLFALALMIISLTQGYVLEKSDNEFWHPESALIRAKRGLSHDDDDGIESGWSEEMSQEMPNSKSRTKRFWWWLFPRPSGPRPRPPCYRAGDGCTVTSSCCHGLTCYYGRLPGSTIRDYTCQY